MKYLLELLGVLVVWLMKGLLGAVLGAVLLYALILWGESAAERGMEIEERLSGEGLNFIPKRRPYP